jgi:DNA modification methylase
MYEPILYGYPARTVNHYFVENRHIANVWEDLSEVKTEYDGAYTTIKFHGFEVRLKGKITEGVVRRKNMRTDIWRYNKPVSNPLHPTMKPVELCAQAVANSSQRGECVLEPFGGSGSTLIACEKLDRKCRLIELDPIYCQVIIDRYEAFVKGAKAKKIELVEAA